MLKSIKKIRSRFDHLAYRFANPFLLVGKNWAKKDDNSPIAVFYGDIPKSKQERLVAAFPDYRCAFEDNRKWAGLRQKYFFRHYRPKHIFLYGSWEKLDEIKQLLHGGETIHRLIPGAFNQTSSQALKRTRVRCRQLALAHGKSKAQVLLIGDNWYEPGGMRAPIKLYFGVPEKYHADLAAVNRRFRVAIWNKDNISASLLTEWGKGHSGYRVVYWLGFDQSRVMKYFKANSIPTETIDPKIPLSFMCASVSSEFAACEAPESSEANEKHIVLLNRGWFSFSILNNSIRNAQVFLPYMDTELDDLLHFPGIQFAGRSNPDLMKIAKAIGDSGNISVLNFVEYPLDLFGWRKNYAVPLFVHVAEKSEGVAPTTGYDVPRILESSTDALDSAMRQRGAEYRDKLMRMHKSIIKQDYLWDPERPEAPAKGIELFIWTDDDASDGSEALTGLAKNADFVSDGREVWCLRLRNGKAVPPSNAEAKEFPANRNFITHVKDIDQVLEKAETVYVDESFLGFEALLMGKRVVTYGKPFFAGWGLTEDRGTVERTRTAALDELVAAAFIVDKSYYAPLSGEQISPEDALALWYVRNRPDISYVIENVLHGRIGEDPRHELIDTRVKVYSGDRELEEWVVEHLRSSLFARVLGDLFSGNMSMEHFAEFIDRGSPAINLRLLEAASYLFMLSAKMDGLPPLFQLYSAWFEDRMSEMDMGQVEEFYRIYLFSASQSKFVMAALPPPPRMPVENDDKSKPYLAAQLTYLSILIRGCFYDSLEKELEERTLDLNALLEIIPAFKTLPWRHERDFDRRQKILRSVLCRVYRAKFSALPKNEDRKISRQVFRVFSQYAAEDFDRLEAQINRIAVLLQKAKPAPYWPMLRVVLNWLIAERDFPLAKKLYHCVAGGLKESMRLGYDVQLGALSSSAPVSAAQRSAYLSVLHKHHRHTNLQHRILAHLGLLEEASKICRVIGRKAPSLTAKMNISRAERLYGFSIEISAIAARVPQPEKPKGYVIPVFYNHITAGLYPLVICELAKAGYATVNICRSRFSFLPLETNVFDACDGLNNLDRGDGEIKLDWDIDLPCRILKFQGYDFYWGMYEALTMDTRRAVLDYQEPVVKKYFRKNLKTLDYFVRMAMTLRQQLTKIKAKGAVLLSVPYAVPQSGLTDYITNVNDPKFRGVFYRPGLPELNPSNPMSTVSLLDYNTYPFCRFPSLARPDRFADWYAANAGKKELEQKIADIRKNFSDYEPPTGPVYEKIMEAKRRGKKIVCCYSRLVLDRAIRHEGGPGHGEMLDWLQHTIEVAGENENVLLLLKPHPHEKVSEYAVDPIDTLKSIIPAELPENVIYLEPDEFSTPQLYGMIDLAVLWLGTAVMELMVMGVPVTVSSHAGQHEIPLAFLRPNSRKEYAELIAAPEHPEVPEKEIEKAAALYLYLGTEEVSMPYKYLFTTFHNYFSYATPYFLPERVEEYFKNGDPYVTRVAEEIIAGLESVE